MKKIAFSIFFIVLVFSLMPTHADDDDDDDRHRPREVIVTNTDPIPMVMTNGTTKKTIVSAYARLTTGEEDHIIMPVALGKQFILTEIFLTSHDPLNNQWFFLKEDSTIKLHVIFADPPPSPLRYMESIKFNSGIPFTPGADVIIYPGFSVDPNEWIDITITGYLVDF